MPRVFLFWLHNCVTISHSALLYWKPNTSKLNCANQIWTALHIPQNQHGANYLILTECTPSKLYRNWNLSHDKALYNKLLKIASWKIKSKRQLLKGNPKCFKTFAWLILIIPSFPLQWWRNTTRWISCLPNNQDIKASLCEVQTLFLCSGQPKAHSENRQGKSQQPAQHKHTSPHCKPVNIHKMLHNVILFLGFLNAEMC